MQETVNPKLPARQSSMMAGQPLPHLLKGPAQWQPTPVLSPGKSHGWSSLEGCSPWGCWGSDTTQRLHIHFSLSCLGEGNGNPLQCSCLENLRDEGAWWVAVYGVAQSWTQLKQLSSSRKQLKTIIFFFFFSPVSPSQIQDIGGGVSLR